MAHQRTWCVLFGSPCFQHVLLHADGIVWDVTFPIGWPFCGRPQQPRCVALMANVPWLEMFGGEADMEPGEALPIKFANPDTNESSPDLGPERD